MNQKNIFFWVVIVSAVFGLWFRIGLVFPLLIFYEFSDHFSQFVQFGGSLKSKRSFIQVIWYLCAWTIWKAINDKKFNNKEVQLCQLLDKVKLLSFRWLKANTVIFAFDYHTWWLNPPFVHDLISLFFDTKQTTFIHSNWYSTSMQYKFAKNKKDKSVSKLTTSMLIA